MMFLSIWHTKCTPNFYFPGPNLKKIIVLGGTIINPGLFNLYYTVWCTLYIMYIHNYHISPRVLHSMSNTIYPVIMLTRCEQ